MTTAFATALDAVPDQRAGRPRASSCSSKPQLGAILTTVLGTAPGTAEVKMGATMTTAAVIGLVLAILSKRSSGQVAKGSGRDCHRGSGRGRRRTVADCLIDGPVIATGSSASRHPLASGRFARHR